MAARPLPPGSGRAALGQPPREVELDLPGTEATAGLGEKNGHVAACVALCGAFGEVVGQQGYQLWIEEHALTSAALGLDVEDGGVQVYIPPIQPHQRPQPDAGSEE